VYRFLCPRNAIRQRVCCSVHKIKKPNRVKSGKIASAFIVGISETLAANNRFNIPPPPLKSKDWINHPRDVVQRYAYMMIYQSIRPRSKGDVDFSCEFFFVHYYASNIFNSTTLRLSCLCHEWCPLVQGIIRDVYDSGTPYNFCPYISLLSIWTITSSKHRHSLTKSPPARFSDGFLCMCAKGSGDGGWWRTWQVWSWTVEGQIAILLLLFFQGRFPSSVQTRGNSDPWPKPNFRKTTTRWGSIFRERCFWLIVTVIVVVFDLYASFCNSITCS